MKTSKPKIQKKTSLLLLTSLFLSSVSAFCQVIPIFKEPPLKLIRKHVNQIHSSNSISGVDKADELFDKHDYTGALKIYEDNSSKLDDVQQYRLAWMYFTGKGVVKNYIKGLSISSILLDKTTNEDIKGYLSSDLGYVLGIKFILADSALSAKMFPAIINASKKNYTHALYCLGYLYEFGPSSIKNYNQALNYFKRASELGDPYSTMLVGSMYRDGNGVPKDINEAIKWYNKAVLQGGGFGYFGLGYLYTNDDYGIKDVSKGMDYYEKGCALGSGTACNNIGSAYMDGKYEPKDYTKAFNAFQKGIDIGNNIAMNNMGILYYNGFGVNKDINQAAIYFKASAYLGYEPAINKLADMYRKEETSLGNIFDAVKLYQKGARLENTYSLYFAGYIFYSWNTYNKAYGYFSKGNDLGDSDCTYMLGVMYQEGKGVDRNLNIATNLFQKAADKGNTKAQAKLNELNNN